MQMVLHTDRSPADQERHESNIAKRIDVLLTHYFVPGIDPEIAVLAMADWIGDLENFTDAVIDAAIREYRRTETKRRPTPGAIRKLCMQEVSRQARISAAAPASELEPERQTFDPAKAGPEVADLMARFRRIPK